jgi:hypothetical protein
LGWSDVVIWQRFQLSFDWWRFFTEEVLSFIQKSELWKLMETLCREVWLTIALARKRNPFQILEKLL